MEYGQFCPIAKATEIVGEKWTLLIFGGQDTLHRSNTDLVAWRENGQPLRALAAPRHPQDPVQRIAERAEPDLPNNSLQAPGWSHRSRPGHEETNPRSEGLRIFSDKIVQRVVAYRSFTWGMGHELGTLKPE